MNMNGSLNGAIKSSNGSATVILDMNKESNGSLVKYVNGNGSAKVVEAKLKSGGDGKKKSIEEIGQEDAWFKGDELKKAEVIIIFCLNSDVRG